MKIRFAISPIIASLIFEVALLPAFSECRAGGHTEQLNGKVYLNSKTLIQKETRFKTGDIIRTSDEGSITLVSTHQRVDLAPSSAAKIGKKERIEILYGHAHSLGLTKLLLSGLQIDYKKNSVGFSEVLADSVRTEKNAKPNLATRKIACMQGSVTAQLVKRKFGHPVILRSGDIVSEDLIPSHVSTQELHITAERLGFFGTPDALSHQ